MRTGTATGDASRTLTKGITMTRLAGTLVAVGGVLLSAGYVLRDPDDLVGVALVAAVLTSTAGVLLMLAGLHPVRPIIRTRAGRLGAVGAGLFLAGLPLAELPMTFVAAAGAAGVEAESMLTEEALPFAMLMAALLATNLGMLLFGIAVARSASLPRIAGVAIALAPVAVMTAPDFPYSEAIAVSVGFLGLSYVGLALRRDAALAQTDSPDRALLV